MFIATRVKQDQMFGQACGLCIMIVCLPTQHTCWSNFWPKAQIYVFQHLWYSLVWNTVTFQCSQILKCLWRDLILNHLKMFRIVSQQFSQLSENDPSSVTRDF